MEDVIWLSLKYVSNYHICIYMGAKFSSIFWIHQSTSPNYFTFNNTVFTHYTIKYLKKIEYSQKSPLLEFKSFLSNWLDFGKLTQVSPLHCLSVCYICQSVSLFVHVSIHTTQIASDFGQQISLCFVCLSISVSVCLSMFASFSTLQLIVIARFDFGQHNTEGSPVLFVCLPVGCYDNTFGWLPSSPTLSEVFPHHHP